MPKPMHPVVKTLWIAALRSGTYKQGRETLRDGENNYCCLGVLCDVHAHKLDTRQSWRQPFPGYHYTYAYADLNLPNAVKHWSGLEDTEPFVVWNDDDQLTFAEIADKIEAEY